MIGAVYILQKVSDTNMSIIQEHLKVIPVVLMEWLLCLPVAVSFSFLHQIVSNQIQSPKLTEHHQITHLMKERGTKDEEISHTGNKQDNMHTSISVGTFYFIFIIFHYFPQAVKKILL